MGVFKVKIPAREEVELTAVSSWTVEWQSRHGEYNSDTRKEFAVFTNQEDAATYKKALDDAFKLIRHTSGNTVRMYKNSEGL